MVEYECNVMLNHHTHYLEYIEHELTDEPIMTFTNEPNVQSNLNPKMSILTPLPSQLKRPGPESNQSRAADREESGGRTDF